MMYLWLLKIILAHLLTDFVLQPRSWVDHRSMRHFGSSRLYLHGLVTGAVAWLFAGWQYWPAALVIMFTHILIDGWKSYQRQTVTYFLADQAMHLLVIAACWYFYFISRGEFFGLLSQIFNSESVWIYATAVVFLTAPAGILIGQLTRQWREKIINAESLANAGKWIGFVERLIVFVFVLLGQYAAISLLVAAKGIIRFNEKDRPEVKTEYLVIGTLMSIGISLLVGVVVKKLLHTDLA
jgi:hypothetical protein